MDVTVTAQDKVLECLDCGEALTREDHRILVHSMSDSFMAHVGFVPEFNMINCPTCNSMNITDRRTEFDRAFERQAFIR